MLTMFVVCISIVAFFLFYKFGKVAGGREGAVVTARVVATMNEMVTTAFTHADRLNASWDRISIAKDKIIASYVKENTELKLEVIEQVKEVFEEEEEDEDEEAFVSAPVVASIQAHSFDRTAATTALELYEQISTANSTLEKIRANMSPASYLLMKEQLKMPGVKHVDIKSAN